MRLIVWKLQNRGVILVNSMVDNETFIQGFEFKRDWGFPVTQEELEQYELAIQKRSLELSEGGKEL